MQKHEISEDRNVLPRMRSLDKTPAHELTSAQLKFKRKDRDTSVYSHSLKSWEKTGSLKDAVEVLNSALTFGLKPEARDAVNQILKPDSEAVDSVKSIARRLLNGRNVDQPEVRLASSINIPEKYWTKIQGLKKRLKLYPRDAISCIDLARVHSSIGQANQASRYVERAVKQCPNNRYIIRSAARFYSHIKEPDIALAVVKHNSVSGSGGDPWIQAAEVSVCNLLGKTPGWGAKKIKSLNQSKAPNISQSEIAAGLAALELKNGNSKSAKKLFERSMLAPTDNSLAQLKWAKSKGLLSKNYMSMLSATVKLSFEANLYDAISKEDGHTAATEAWNWLADEPYSSQPALIGSSICSGVLNDLERAIEFAEQGIIATPNEPFLLNNKLFALARLGEITKAQEILPQLQKWKHDGKFEPFFHAAQGIIEFRKKNITAGRTHYSNAVNAAKAKDNKGRMMLALIHWFEEEVIYGSFGAEIIKKNIDDFDRMFAKDKNLKRKFYLTWPAMKQRILESTKQHKFKFKQVFRKITSKDDSADSFLNLTN